MYPSHNIEEELVKTQWKEKKNNVKEQEPGNINTKNNTSTQLSHFLSLSFDTSKAKLSKHNTSKMRKKKKREKQSENDGRSAKTMNDNTIFFFITSNNIEISPLESCCYFKSHFCQVFFFFFFLMLLKEHDFINDVASKHNMIQAVRDKKKKKKTKTIAIFGVFSFGLPSFKFLYTLHQPVLFSWASWFPIYYAHSIKVPAITKNRRDTVINMISKTWSHRTTTPVFPSAINSVFFLPPLPSLLPCCHHHLSQMVILLLMSLLLVDLFVVLDFPLVVAHLPFRCKTLLCVWVRKKSSPCFLSFPIQLFL